MGIAPTIDMITCTTPGHDSKYLYSGIRADNPFLTAEEVEQAILMTQPLMAKSSNGSQLVLHQNYTMSFADVYETLYYEEQQSLQDKFAPEEAQTLKDLMNVTVHFYSEEATGASIMIPEQCTLSSSTDDYGTLNTTTSPGGLIRMSIYISSGSSTQEAVDAMNSFQKFIRPEGKDFIPVNADSVAKNNNYYSLNYEYKHKLGQGTKSIVYARMTIDESNFLAVSVNVEDWPSVAQDPREKMYFYLMEVCSNLSNFPIY